MSKFKKQIQPLTALHEFAKNQLSNSLIKDFASKPSWQKDKSQFGLSTLLHFNNNETISSVKSRGEISLTMQNPQFGVEVREEIQQLKAKRLEIERRWKHSQASNDRKMQKEKMQAMNENLETSSISESSQVEVYSQQMQKAKYRRPTQEYLIYDRFIADLKKEIRDDKARQFITILKKLVLRQFLKELKKYQQILEARLKAHQNLKKNIFEQWKEFTQNTKQRDALRKMITSRIKHRKIVKEINS